MHGLVVGNYKFIDAGGRALLTFIKPCHENQGDTGEYGWDTDDKAREDGGSPEMFCICTGRGNDYKK